MGETGISLRGVDDDSGEVNKDEFLTSAESTSSLGLLSLAALLLPPFFLPKVVLRRRGVWREGVAPDRRGSSLGKEIGGGS